MTTVSSFVISPTEVPQATPCASVERFFSPRAIDGTFHFLEDSALRLVEIVCDTVGWSFRRRMKISPKRHPTSSS
jgi:hypothetical protein